MNSNQQEHLKLMTVRTSAGGSNQEVNLQGCHLGTFVMNEFFLNGSHLIYGSTRSGKTLLACCLIRRLILEHPARTFALVILAQSENAFLKFSILNKYFNNVGEVSIKDIVRLKSVDKLEDLYLKIINDKNQKTSSFVNSDEATIKLPDQQKSLNYIFLIDDFSSLYSCIKKQAFLNCLFTQNRQYGVTIIYTSQLIHKFVPELKTNNESVTIIGDVSENEAKIFYSGFSSISKIFSSQLLFNRFICEKHLVLKNGTSTTFKKTYSKYDNPFFGQEDCERKRLIFTHRIKDKLVEFMLAEEAKNL